MFGFEEYCFRKSSFHFGGYFLSVFAESVALQEAVRIHCFLILVDLQKRTSALWFKGIFSSPPVMMSCSDNVFFKTSATRFRPVDGDASFCLSCGLPLTVLNREEVPLGKLCWECSIMTSGNRALHSATGWLRGETSRQGEKRKPRRWASVLLKFSSTFLLPSRDIYYSFKVVHILPNLLSLPPYVH